MKRFVNGKLAFTLSCMSVLGSRISAVSKSEISVKNSKSIDAVSNVDFRNNSVMPSFGKSKYRQLETALIAALSGLVGLGLINEILGITTNADTLFKGKYSIANSVRQSFARKILVEKISDVLDSFSDILELRVEDCGEYRSAKTKKLFDHEKVELEKIKMEMFLKAVKNKNIDLDESLSRIKFSCHEKRKIEEENIRIEKIKALLNLRRLYGLITGWNSGDLENAVLKGIRGSVNAVAILDNNGIAVTDLDNNTVNLFKICKYDGNLEWDIEGKDPEDYQYFKLMIRK